ncbi:hypothetical protein [Seinonella peptonophila]|nr:hypothetical protein [Seinonella peptonophila]
MATYLKDPSSRDTSIEPYTFSEMDRFTRFHFRTFERFSTDYRPYQFEIEKLEPLQAAAQQAAENFLEAHQNPDLRSQLSETSFDNFMQIYTHIAERIQHTKVKQALRGIESLPIQHRDNHQAAMEQIADIHRERSTLWLE